MVSVKYNGAQNICTWHDNIITITMSYVFERFDTTNGVLKSYQCLPLALLKFQSFKNSKNGRKRTTGLKKIYYVYFWKKDTVKTLKGTKYLIFFLKYCL